MPIFTGMAGNDIFTGGGDDDKLLGNGGNDTLTGGGGLDILAGGAGADTLDGGDGADTLYSGDVTPTYSFPHPNYSWTAPLLDTGTEHDVLKGGAGDDRLFAGYGDDVDGGAQGSYGDFLFISFMGASSGVTYDSRLATQTIGGGTITGVESVSWLQGSNFDDDINIGIPNYNGYGDSAAVFGMGGNDKLVAGYNTGSLFGGDGDDILDGRPSQYLNTLDGGAGNDTIYGNSSSPGSIFGGDGDDTIYASSVTHGGAGNDKIIVQFSYTSRLIYGDEGDDDLQASSGGNSLAGGAGADKLTGGDQVDRLYSADRDDGYDTPLDDMGLEHDVLSGLGGDDVLAAGYGDDVDGGGGTDTLRLSLGGATSGVAFDTAGIVSGQPFTFAGGTIKDVEKLVYLRGGEFADTLTLATQGELLNVDAGAGNDVIISATSSVSVKGGAGDDRFVSGAAGDIFDGGSGFDTVDYSRYASGVTVSLIDKTGAGGDQLFNVEAVIGSAFADTLTGDSAANTLRGGGGDDVIDGGGGKDTVQYAGASTDYSWTQGANGSWTVRDLRAGAADGVDTLKGVEALKFSDKLVQLPVTPVTHVINGTTSDDTLVATSDNDVIDGRAGNDTVQFDGASTDFSWTQGSDSSWTVRDLRVDAPQGVDILKNVEQLKFTDKVVAIAAPPPNVIVGTGGNDNLYGASGNDVIRGAGGDDYLYGSPGDDTLDGGVGQDWAQFMMSTQGVRVDLAIKGPQNTGEGNDTFVSIENVWGGAYDDVIYGDDGANILAGYNGADQLNGRDGDDNIGGDAGNDILHGGAGNDFLTGGSGDDFVYGEAGDDSISLHSETTGSPMGNDYVDGGDGVDTVKLGFIDFGVSIDLAVTTEQQIASGVTLTIKNVERLYGWEFADKLTGNAADNLFNGDNGNDIIDGRGGVDTVEMNGNSTDFAVTWTVNGWQIADKRPYVSPSTLGGGTYDGVDLVKNVEFIRYFDKTVALGDGMPFVVANILRTSGATGASVADALSTRLAAGSLTAAQAVAELVNKADATTSVASMSYQFFTGKVPSQVGIDFLISPTGPNPNNLNSAYYAKFDPINRYINFAANLGKYGEAKDSFAADYGALSLFEATRKAYAAIFGGTPNDAKVHQLLDGRVDFLAWNGGDGAEGIGTKAAMVGFLLAAAATENLGVIAKSNDAWLTDLADGSAPFAVNILDPANGYYKADFVFGG